MKRGIIAVIVLSVCLFAFQRSSFAEDDPDKFSIRVGVRIHDGNDVPIESQIESYIKRELRALGDVIVTDTDAQIILDITVLDISSDPDSEKGLQYAWAVAILFPLKSIVSYCVRDSQAPPERLLKPANLFSPGEFSTYAETWLWQVGGNKIEAANKRIVADLDTCWIELYRKRHQGRLDSLKKEEANNTPTPPKAQED